MSLKGKAGAAALTLVAPEAEAAKVGAGAAAAAGGAGKRRRPAVADPRVTRPGSEAARQRQVIEDIKANRPPEVEQNHPVMPEDDTSDSGMADGDAGPGRIRSAATRAVTDQTGSPGWWPSNPDPIKASNAGAGFLLAIFGWAFIRAYLSGGTDEMKKLARAKFLNQTEGGT